MQTEQHYYPPPEIDDVFWILLSLLLLPVEKQISVIGGLPTKGDPLVIDFPKNG